MDFAKSISFKSYGIFLLHWHCRPYVHADLLDGTAFKALSLVACTKGPMYKKGVDTSLHPSTSWG